MLIRTEKIITIEEVVGFEVVDEMKSINALTLINNNTMIKITIKPDNDVVVTQINWEEYNEKYKKRKH